MPYKHGMGRHTTPLNVPEAPVFRPTMEEFKDFNKYVEFLETTDAPKAGICKIVVPNEWVPRKIGYKIEDLNYTITGPIKQNFNQVGVKGTYQTKGILKPAMTVQEYYKLANSHTYRPPVHSSYDDLERKYWKSLSFVPPIYGCDVADHLTDPEEESWNIAKLGSTLDLIKEDKEIDIKGVLSPYLYFGMWKATFSWHIEDMDLYAINFVHHGEPKTWYCVPPQYGHLLEKAAREIFPNVASWCSNFMRHKTCMISPEMLDKYGVPYQKVVQEERCVIITWPYAYHCGFNHGFNIAESTNFATPKWVEYGKRSRPCDCNKSRVSFSMDIFVKKFQPERYEDWIKKRDIAPHPEDPPEVAAEIRMRAEDPKGYKAMMADRMKLKEEKKRTRFSKAKTSSVDAGGDHEPEEMVTVDLYQHPEKRNLKVEVNPITMKCRGNGMTRLRDFLDDEPNPDVKDLIERGLLIKIGSLKVQKSTKRPRDEDEEDEANAEKVEVLIYKHVGEPQIEAVVDPASLELVGPQTEFLVKFLKDVNMPIKTLIEMGIFTKFIEAKISIAKEPMDEQTRPPPMKKMKTEELAASKISGPVRKVELHRYKCPTSGLIIKVNPTNLRPFYKLTQQANYFLRERSIRDAIDDGSLAFDGAQEVLAKIVAPPSVVAPKIEPSTSGQTSTSEQRRFVAADVYKTKDGQMYVNVSQKTTKILGRKSDDLIKILEGKTVEELIESGELIYVGQRKVGQRELNNPEPTAGNDPNDESEIPFEETPDSVSFVEDEPTNDDYDSDVQFIEEDDPEETLKIAETKKPRPADVMVYSDSDDDSDDMLYTSEDSSESNESDDDPNYGSGRRGDANWSHRSNKTKKKKLKKMRKMKLLSRMERDHRRNLTSEQRAQLKEQKRQKRAKAVDARSAADLTRAIVTYLNKKFESSSPDIAHDFTIAELKEEFKEDRSNIASVIRIFEGLEIVERDTEQEDDVYFWSGVDFEKLNKIFLNILDGGEDKENNIWLVFRNFIKVLLNNRKGVRVHPDIVGKSHYGVNETRRVTLSAAVLEGLDLVIRKTDTIGGVVWTGKDLWSIWLEDQCRKYYDEAEVLKTMRVVLEQAQVSAEDLELATEGLLQHLASMLETPVVAIDGLSYEQQRSVVNQKIVCKCGTTKKMTSGEGSKVNRTSVWTGFKKRSRCKECPGCLAKKCGECNHCLKPHLKKPCVLKVCQFPVVPKCPCFA